MAQTRRIASSSKATLNKESHVNSHTEVRVSVLMPTFNQARFLDRALENLLAQTFPGWELLIVDDGSSDDTAEVLARWTHPQFRCHRLNGNQGFAAALSALQIARHGATCTKNE